MKRQTVLWCALGAAGVAWLAGCAGQRANVDGAPGAAGPEARSTDDYRKVRFDESFRGLGVVDGLLAVDHEAGRGLAATDAAAAMARGDAMLAENDFTGAIGEYRSALLTDETLGRAYAQIGTALMGKRKDEFALAAFRTAVMLQPEDAALRVQYAEMINATGDLRGWAAELERALEIDPANGRAHARLAVARYYLGDRDGARRQVELADRFGGEVPGALRGLLEN